MILNEVMKETADAIREKTGKSDLIAPVDFAEEIKGITAGGGSGESGGSSWRYFDVSKMAEEDKAQIVSTFALIVRVMVQTNDVICPPRTSDLDRAKTLAFGFDSSMPYRNKYFEGINTIGELFAMAGGDEILNELDIVEITEDEFTNKTFE